MTKHNLETNGLPKHVITSALEKFDESQRDILRDQVIKEISNAAELIRNNGGHITWHRKKCCGKCTCE